MQQAVETPFRAQAVKRWVHIQENQPKGALLKRPLQPFERLLRLA